MKEKFGEESMLKMVDWVVENVPSSSSQNILEVGTGNGILLCELASNGYDPSRLLGVDYSSGSIALSSKVAKSRGVEKINFSQCDILSEDPPKIAGADGDGDRVDLWDLVLDKGTFDAIALSVPDAEGKLPAQLYPSRIARLLRPGGFFLLTSCNFTEDEMKERFVIDELGLVYHSRIQHQVYSYGGRSGSICSTIAFQKIK